MPLAGFVGICFWNNTLAFLQHAHLECPSAKNRGDRAPDQKDAMESRILETRDLITKNVLVMFWALKNPKQPRNIFYISPSKSKTPTFFRIDQRKTLPTNTCWDSTRRFRKVSLSKVEWPWQGHHTPRSLNGSSQRTMSRKRYFL